MSEERGVWQSRSGAKGQSRSPTSLRLSLGQEKKEFQSSIRGGAGRGQGTSKDRGITWQGQEAPQHADTNSTPLPEEDLPTDGYNSVAVEAAMKVPAEPPPSIYQPSEKPKSVGRSGSTPRASKPNCMANGRDFWADLRKQYTALQRSGAIREGD